MTGTHQARMHKHIAILVPLAAVFCVLACVNPSFAQKKTVLWLDSYSLDYDWSAAVYQGILSVMRGRDIHVITEHMDTKRYDDAEYLEKLFDVYRHKYATKKIDVVIALGDHAFQFMLKHHDALCPETPIVFCGVNKFDSHMLQGAEHLFTGVVEDFDILGTVEVIRRLQPAVTKLLVISDHTESGQKNLERLGHILPDLRKFFHVSIVEQWSLDDLKRQSSHLPNDTAILILALFQDMYGNRLNMQNALPQLAAHSRVPLYSCWDVWLGFGIVGGKLVSGFSQGQTAAGLAMRVLSGESPPSIPIVYESPNAYMFDHHQLQRFGIAASLLPEGSSLINKPAPDPHVSRAYYTLLWTVIGLLGLGIIALAGVVLHRRRYEAALRESEAKYRDLFDHSADIVYTHDMDGNYTSVNEAATKVLGFEKEEFIGKNFRSIVDPEFLPATEAFFDMKRRGEADKTGPYEVSVHAKDGRKVWFEVKTRTMFRDGKAVGVHGSARDITEKKRLQEELREAQERYRAFIEEAQDLIIETDARGRYTYVNPATAALTGYSEEELIGKSSLSLVAPEYREAAKELYESQGRERYAFTYVELPYMAKNGARFWLGARTHLIVEDGEIKGARCIARDVTERKKAEDALKEREAKYKELYRMVRLMCDNSPDMIWAKDLEGRFIFANRALCEKLLGATDTDEPVGKTDMFFAERERLSHPDDPSWHTFGEICIDSDAVIREERAPRRFDEFGNVKGKFLFLDVFKAPMLDEQGQMIGVVGSAREVTEQKRQEEERARLITAINQTADSIVITDSRGVIQFVNPAFEKITGYTKEEAIGKTPRILKSGKHSPEFYKKLWLTLRAKKAWTGRFINRKKDGSLYEEDATITPVRDSSGRVVSYVAVKRDVTQESMLQKELLHAQKMEALGTLAGGIAHDLNNILQVVLGYCQILQAKLTDEASRKGLSAVTAATRRAGDLVSRVLTFSRKMETDARPLDLNDQIRRVHELLFRTIPKMVDIRLELADNLHLIQGDPLQIEQVLMNLSVNAAHAMPDGGVLTIRTQNVTLGIDFCARHPEAFPGDYALMTVTDTGAGMEEEVLSRIFEPFFTTKKIGEGTGLGLSIVYGIMASHKGFIRCESQPGAGTTFSLYFPKLQEVVEDVSVQEAAANLSGCETILLVDDEDEVVSLAGEAFAGYGYTLYTARTGEEALQLYQEYGKKIDLIVLDLVMPGMGGRRCLKELREMDPTVRVLVASGFATEETVRQVLKSGAVAFLRKPFEFEELLAQIRAILDGGASLS